MTLPPLPDRAVRELGRTEGGIDTLALLVREQDTRRMLMLRAVLDAAQTADAGVCPAGALRRLREDWALLEESDRVGPGRAGAAYGRVAGETPTGGSRTGSGSDHRRPDHLSPARARLLHPLVGPWARRCLRGLRGTGAGPIGQSARRRELAQDLAHFSALAAVAAARSGLSFTVRLTARDGVLTLPSLGALRTTRSGDVPVDVVHRRGRLRLRQSDAPDAEVRLESGLGAWSSAPAWTPAYALPGLVPGAGPMPLDDLDPYRTGRGGPRHHGLSEPVTLDDAERKRWLQAWSGVAPALRLGGEHRVGEAVVLLRCLVPLAPGPGGAAEGRPTGGYSATRREAFGAVLSSTPPTPTGFAATLVHELQHTKLTSLCELVTLHHANHRARYFAPWRLDPRPYDGLLQGAYSHLALADFFQRHALTEAHPARRESAWSQHARYREQVGAVLPALVGSSGLTPRGRQFVDELVAVHERMAEHPAPRDHAARAHAYVEAARALWQQRHTAELGQSRD